MRSCFLKSKVILLSFAAIGRSWMTCTFGCGGIPRNRWMSLVSVSEVIVEMKKFSGGKTESHRMREAE